MNILFFTHHLSQGGAEKTVRTLSEYFNQHTESDGIVSHICVVYDDPNLRPYPSNVHVLQTRSEEKDGKFKKALNVLRQIAEVRKLKKELQIDVCVSFLPGADIINVLSGVGEKQIVSVRNIESLFTHSVWKKRYVQTAYRKCDAIVACSETVRRDCIDFFHVPEKKIIAIPNSAPEVPEEKPVTEVFQAFVETHDCITNVARLAPEKGQVHLLKAFAAWMKKGDCTSDSQRHKAPGLVFIGDGPLRKDLEAAAARLGTADSVFFCGRQSNPVDYLKRSKLFVLSSNVEGMPNVLVEALQAGLPCVATECGAREILAPETDPIADRTSGIDCAVYGILVPVCGRETTDAEARAFCESNTVSPEEQIMADAIEKLYSDPLLQEQYRSRTAEALKPLALPVIAGRWHKEFDDVTGK